MAHRFIKTAYFSRENLTYVHVIFMLANNFYLCKLHFIIIAGSVSHSNLFIRTILCIFYFSLNKLLKLGKSWHSYSERGRQLFSCRVQKAHRFTKLMGNILCTFYKLSNASVSFSLSTRTVLQQTTLEDLWVPRVISMSTSFSFLFFTTIICIMKLSDHVFISKVLTKASYLVKETRRLSLGSHSCHQPKLPHKCQ